MIQPNKQKAIPKGAYYNPELLSYIKKEKDNRADDRAELNSTGQIKNPRSFLNKTNAEKLSGRKTAVDKQKRSVEEMGRVDKSIRDAENDSKNLTRPLIYLNNPNKLIGDAAKAIKPDNKLGLETSEKERQDLSYNTHSIYKSGREKLAYSLNKGVEMVPGAALNIALAGEGAGASGALRTINNALNPLAGSGTNILRAKSAANRAINGRLTRVSALNEIKRTGSEAAVGTFKDEAKDRLLNRSDDKAKEMLKNAKFKFKEPDVRELNIDPATSIARTNNTREVDDEMIQIQRNEDFNRRLSEISTNRNGAEANQSARISRTQTDDNISPVITSDDEELTYSTRRSSNEIDVNSFFSNRASINELLNPTPLTKRQKVNKFGNSVKEDLSKAVSAIKNPKRTIDNAKSYIARNKELGSFSPKSIYYNTQRNLAGDSKSHAFLNMSPKEVSDEVGNIMRKVPKGGQFGEASLSSDSFRLMTPKMGASLKDYKLINTGKLNPLNGLGNKSKQLNRDFGNAEASKKTSDLMNNYIERLERTSGQKITRSKVIDGQVYIPQLLMEKKGGSALSKLKRAQDQIAISSAAVGSVAMPSAIDYANNYSEEKYKKLIEEYKSKNKNKDSKKR